MNFIKRLLILTCSLTVFCYASESIPAELDSLILKGKDHIYNLDMAQADSVFIEAQTRYPGHPHGYVYQSYVTTLIYTLDLSNDSLRALLTEQMDRSLDRASTYLDTDKDHPERFFYLGLANAIKGMYHVVNRNYVRGYWYGRKAKNNLKKTVEIDSTLYDTYLGLGLVHYYADLLPGVIKFFAGVLGFDGDRDRGIKEIRLTADKGHFFRIESEFLYYCIKYFLEGERNAGIKGLRNMYRRLPRNDALVLMLAYHHRRRGDTEQCIDYCNKIDETRYPLLPQIPNLKYYNLAVSRYDQNRFDTADSLFQELEDLPTRKSPYYQAAINYYRGHLADLRFDRQAAQNYYNQIEKTSQTKYWYWISRTPLSFGMDSLMVGYFELCNDLYNRKFKTTLPRIDSTRKAGGTSAHPDYQLLMSDLYAENLYFLKRYNEAEAVFAEVIPQIEKKMKDQFRRAWAYIHYARCERQSGNYDHALKLLDKAHRLDEDYTRLIVSREKFIIEKARKKEAEKKE